MTRPVLRYYGGKFRVADWVISHFPPHRIYLEAFSGAASILMRKRRAYAEIMNDLDDEIVNIFRVLRDPDQAEQLRVAILLTPYARSEFLAAYEPATDPVERARRLVLRSFAGFGAKPLRQRTGFRTNSSPWGVNTGFRSDAKRSGSTPAKDWSTWPDSIPAFVKRLRGVVIEQRDAVELLNQHDSDETLHYLDPPYLMSTRSEKTAYAHELDEAGHRRLAEVARGLKGRVVLSGYRSDLYDEELYPDWPRVERSTYADGQRPRTEVLWLSPSAFRDLEASRSPLFS